MHDIFDEITLKLKKKISTADFLRRKKLYQNGCASRDLVIFANKVYLNAHRLLVENVF